MILGSGVKEWKITAISGTVKILRASYVDYTTTKTSAYSNANAISASVNDVLYGGDFLISARNSGFTIRITAGDYSLTDFTGIPIVTLLTN